MKKISKWAQHHPALARLIITISHLLIIANGLLAGLFLFLNDWQHARYTMCLLMFSFSLLFIFYPKRGQKTGLFKYSYRSQKTHDFGLVLFSFLMISVGSNNWLSQNMATEITSTPAATFIVHKQKKPSKKQVKKQVRKELRALKKKFKKRKNKKGTDKNKILLSFLLFWAASSLAGLIGLLACNLSCSGNSGAATMVLYGGIIGIVILLALSIYLIWKKNPN